MFTSFEPDEIEAIKVALGFTLDDFAQELSASKQSIADYTKGRSKPGRKNYLQLRQLENCIVMLDELRVSGAWNNEHDVAIDRAFATGASKPFRTGMAGMFPETRADILRKIQ